MAVELGDCKLAFLYDGVLHCETKHSFFARGSTAALLGLKTPSLDGYHDLRSGGLLDACRFRTGADPQECEAFAYSAFHGDFFLLALRLGLDEADDAGQAATSSWLVLEVRLSDLQGAVATLSVAPWEGSGGGGGRAADRCAAPLLVPPECHRALLRHLRPLQGFVATMLCRAEEGGAVSFTLQRLKLVWTASQLKLAGAASQLACASVATSADPHELAATLEPLMKGRSPAFPHRLGQSCYAMLVSRREKHFQGGVFLNLTFVAVCLFRKDSSRFWSRKVQFLWTQERDGPLWHLLPGAKVQAELVEEWRQVDCGKHLVLDRVCGAAPDAVVLERSAEPSGAPRDIFDGGPERWCELWRLEEHKSPQQRRYWSEHLDGRPGPIELLDDDGEDVDVDVAAAVRDCFGRVDGLLDKKVKYEILKEKETERRVQDRAATSAAMAQQQQQAPVHDPYALACDALNPTTAAATEAPFKRAPAEGAAPESAKVEGAGPDSAKLEGDDGGWWKSRWHGGGGRWSRGSWGNYRGGWSSRPGAWEGQHASKRARDPSPPARSRRWSSETSALVRYRHQEAPVPHAWGEAVAAEKLWPLRQLRYAIETWGTAVEGHVEAYERRVSEAIWECLPQAASDERSRFFEAVMRDIGVLDRRAA